MAFLTLEQVRTGYLNPELGLVTDSDNAFGDEAARRFYIQNAIRKLWPTVARLYTETITTASDQQFYTPAMRDIERIEVEDANLNVDRVASWRLVTDEATDPVVNRLLIPQMSSGMTLRLIGYAPYAVPATDADAVDFPVSIVHAVVAGARVEAYRAKINRFANYAQFANENRQNVLQPAELLELLRQAEREFERLKLAYARDFTAAKRGRTQTG